MMKNKFESATTIAVTTSDYMLSIKEVFLYYAELPEVLSSIFHPISEHIVKA
jgi:hypothetical protein